MPWMPVRVGPVRRQLDLDDRVVELAQAAKLSPTGASAGRSMMPSCSSESCNSRSEHIMPWLSTPRILPTPSVTSMPGT